MAHLPPPGALPCPLHTASTPAGRVQDSGLLQPLCFPGSQPRAPGAHGQTPSVPQLPRQPGPSAGFTFSLPGFTTILPAHSGASCRGEEGSYVPLEGDGPDSPFSSAHHLLVVVQTLRTVRCQPS